MKQSIEYYYNLNLEDLKVYKNYAVFNYNNNKYYYVFLPRNPKELEDIIYCSREMKKRGINCHDIIYNKFNDVISTFGEDNYVLLKINKNELNKLDIFDLVDNGAKLSLSNNKFNLYRNEWGKLWAAKIDYFEDQIRQLGKNKKGIINSFSYYIGLAENALIYYNATQKTETLDYNVDKIVLSHRRIFYPNIWLNYANPLSFVFDLEVRDVAEYLKSMFFKEGIKETLEETKAYLKIKNLSKYSYQMFYARLLFPSYYFDVYEKVMNEELEEEALIDIVDKVNDFEQYLKEVYLEIYKHIEIEKIPWLIK
ncbi:MAG: hypothetical protein IJA94_03250 [Bacilli bacterium]|nr:hypothetical protein [Bacilli bacterium]